MDQHGDHSFRPTIFCGDLTKPPAALWPLCTRDQWAIWRLTWRQERWTKPPFRADQPHRFARSNDPSSWSAYAAAVTAAADGDGVTYMLTPEDEVAAVDIDQVRDPETGTIEAWAQQLLNQTSHAYAEISPSGTGLRIWGTASGEPLHRTALPMALRSNSSGAPASR
jgi:primase-polymerase (primpol)-like protein